MKKSILLIIILIMNYCISCSEQDLYSIKALPQINILDIDTSSAIIEIKTDTIRHLVITISESDNVNLSRSRLNEIIKDTVYYSKIEFDNNIGIIYNNKIKTGDFLYLYELAKRTTFYLTLYIIDDEKIEVHKKLRLKTVEALPTEQARNITFSNVGRNEITIGWTPGNGIGRLVLIRKDTFPEFPSDGMEVIANSKYGDIKSKIGENTYCIYNSTSFKDNQVTVSNLTPGKYYFLVIEYNGEPQYRNYLKTTTTNNLRFKATSFGAPIALEGEVVDEFNFVARWEKQPEVEYYLLDVAEDENFINIIQPFENVDVGDSNLVEIQIPYSLKEKPVYYRLRAFSNGTISETSNIIRVEKK